jgi:regulator of cell morphogenesis and NO signaling
MKSYKIDGNKQVIFSKDMNLIELIDADYHLLSVLMRLDIELPFGDITVEQMCKRYGMSPTLFLMICRIYSAADYTPDYTTLAIDDITYVIKYLRASHRYYQNTLLPRITAGVDGVLQLCEERQRIALGKFCRDYADEVRAHLEYEENEIFPYIEALVRNDRQMISISDFVHNHTDICEKIDDMKSLVVKYLPESCSIAQRCDLLFDIFALREDLARHTLLEMKILAPLVEREERRLK